jgi:hypothetical protein
MSITIDHRPSIVVHLLVPSIILHPHRLRSIYSYSYSCSSNSSSSSSSSSVYECPIPGAYRA